MNVMQAQVGLKSAAVRIACLDNRCAGAGFLVGPRTILTCTQVVNRAFGRPLNDRQIVPREIRISFPLISSTNLYSANIVFWDVKRSIAGLLLESELPVEAAPSGLLSVNALWGLSIHTFGYPMDTMRGIGSIGMVSGSANGNGARLKTMNGYPSLLDAGFTGAPVWDDLHQGVIGMIAGIDTARDEALMFPTDALGEAWPRLTEYSTAPRRSIDLDAYRLQDDEIKRINHNFVQPKGYNRVREALQENRLVIVVGKSGLGKQTCVLQIASNRSPRRPVLVFPRYTGWETISQQDIAQSTLVLPDALGLDRLERDYLDEEMVFLERLIQNGNQVVITLREDVHAQAAGALHPPGGTFRNINPQFVFLDDPQYENGELLKISKKLLRRADELKIIDDKQRHWAASVAKDRADLTASLLPADIEHYIFQSLGYANSRIDVEERLRQEVAGDGGLEGWFINLEPACQVFLLALAIFAGFPNDALWERYRRISLGLRSLNPNLSLVPLGVLRQQCYPYVTVDGPADFTSEKHALRIRRLIVLRMREYFLEVLPMIRNWAVSDPGNSYLSGDYYQTPDQLIAPSNSRSDQTHMAVAELVGEAAKYGLEDVRETLEGWADDPALQNGPEMVGIALFRMATDSTNAQKALTLIQSWSNGSQPIGDHHVQRQAVAAAGTGWVALANPVDSSLHISLLRILYRLARNKDTAEIAHQAAVSATRMSRLVEWEALLPVLIVLGKDEKSNTRRQVAYALDGAFLAGRHVYPLLEEWCQSENVMYLWTGVYSTLLFGMRMERSQRHSLLGRALLRNPKQVANAMQAFMDEPGAGVLLTGINVINDYSQLPPAGEHMMLVSALKIVQDEKPAAIDDLYRKLVAFDPGAADSVLAETRVVGYLSRIEDQTSDGTRSLADLLENDLRDPSFTRRSWRVLEILARGYAGPGAPRLVQPLTAAIQYRTECVKLWNQRLLEQPNQVVESLRNTVYLENQQQIAQFSEHLSARLAEQPVEVIDQIESTLLGDLRASVAWSTLVVLVDHEKSSRDHLINALTLFVLQSGHGTNGLHAIRQVGQKEQIVQSAILEAYVGCLKKIGYPYAGLFKIRGDLFLDLFYRTTQDGDSEHLAWHRLNSLCIPRRLTLTGRRSRLVERLADGLVLEGGEPAFEKIDFLDQSTDPNLQNLKEEVIQQFHDRFRDESSTEPNYST